MSGSSGPWMTGGVGVSCPLLEGKVLGSNPVLDTLDNGGLVGFHFHSSCLFGLFWLYPQTFCLGLAVLALCCCLALTFFLASAWYNSFAALTTLSA